MIVPYYNISQEFKRIEKPFFRSISRIGNSGKTNDKSIENGYDLQVTHSNFNYKKVGSDLLNKDDKSLKPYPGKANKYSKFVIYPHLVKGKYRATLGGQFFEIGERKSILQVPVNKKNREITFSALDGKLPSRLQLGIVSQNDLKRIPNEVAFSAITTIEPMKRFHWGVCGFGKNIKTKLIVCDLKNLDIKKQRPKPLTINLYLAKNKKIVSKSLYKLEDIKKLKN